MSFMECLVVVMLKPYTVYGKLLLEFSYMIIIMIVTSAASVVVVVVDVLFVCVRFTISVQFSYIFTRVFVCFSTTVLRSHLRTTRKLPDQARQFPSAHWSVHAHTHTHTDTRSIRCHYDYCFHHHQN